MGVKRVCPGTRVESVANVIVYRAAVEPIDPPHELRRLVQRTGALPPASCHRSALSSIFIDVAELESAVADALFPDRDGLHPVAGGLAAATAAAARAVLACWKGADSRLSVLELSSALARLDPAILPPVAERRVSEGYAYYALHPETYATAAQHFVQAVRPTTAAVVGIRTIGSGLAAIVVAALQDKGVSAASWSVRPHGHPFDRTLALAEDLAGVLGRQPAGTHFLVVDEGPGISGTSFASVTEVLEGLRIPPEHIHLFPSWTPDASALQSTRAQTAWARYRTWHAGAAEAGVGVARVREGCLDWSGGAWRRHLYRDESEWPAAMPSHERVKLYHPSERMVYRFAGLGRYGETRRARAEALAGAGLGVVPGALVDGYLPLPCEPGRPCTRDDASQDLVERIAAHVAYLSRACPARRAPGLDEVQHMIETNAREADPSIAVPPLAAWGSAIRDAPAAAIDGRMLAHEWIRTRSGFLKTDALDHSADHFFPGTQDPAWDLAGAAAEFELSPAAARMLVDRYAQRSGDRGVRSRVLFHEVAYAAFSLGYAAFAAHSLRGSPEAGRFDARCIRFRARLRAALAGLSPVSSQ
jgi:hypothetical protein